MLLARWRMRSAVTIVFLRLLLPAAAAILLMFFSAAAADVADYFCAPAIDVRQALLSRFFACQSLLHERHRITTPE